MPHHKWMLVMAESSRWLCSLSFLFTGDEFLSKQTSNFVTYTGRFCCTPVTKLLRVWWALICRFILGTWRQAKWWGKLLRRLGPWDMAGGKERGQGETNGAGHANLIIQHAHLHGDTCQQHIELCTRQSEENTLKVSAVGILLPVWVENNIWAGEEAVSHMWVSKYMCKVGWSDQLCPLVI